MPEEEKLTSRERELIAKWRAFYASLVDGSREPETDEQLHFALACRGLVPAETEHEVAYSKYLKANDLPREQARSRHPRESGATAERRVVGQRTGSETTKVPDDSPEPQRTDVPTSEFAARCVHLCQRFTMLSASGVDRSSFMADRVRRVRARVEERGYVAKGDLGEVRSLERRAESAEEHLASLPKVDKSIEHEKRASGYIKIGGGGGGWADHEPGTPRPGWFTDDDYRKSHSNRASDLKARNAPED